MDYRELILLILDKVQDTDILELVYKILVKSL